MAKGIVAFVSITSLIMAISIMSGLGIYAELNVSYSNSSSQDVQNAADAMIGQEATDQSGGSVLQDFTTSAAQTLSTIWQVLANTSGVLQLLFGVPAVLANQIQLFFQIVFSITFAAFIRGVVLQ